MFFTRFPVGPKNAVFVKNGRFWRFLKNGEKHDAFYENGPVSMHVFMHFYEN